MAEGGDLGRLSDREGLLLSGFEDVSQDEQSDRVVLRIGVLQDALDSRAFDPDADDLLAVGRKPQGGRSFLGYVGQLSVLEAETVAGAVVENDPHARP